jgi:hypothetical protein
VKRTISAQSTQRLAEVRAPGPLVARAVSGELLVPAPVDYVAWTRPAAALARRDDLRAPRRLAWLSGEMSPRAHRQFALLGWSVY